MFFEDLAITYKPYKPYILYLQYCSLKLLGNSEKLKAWKLGDGGKGKGCCSHIKWSSFLVIHVNGGWNCASLQVSTQAAQTTMSHKLMRMSQIWIKQTKEKKSSQQEEKVMANVINKGKRE